MPGQEVELGPFTGLYLRDVADVKDSSSAPENRLVELKNLEITPAGTLIPRQHIYKISNASSPYNVAPTAYVNLIGEFTEAGYNTFPDYESGNTVTIFHARLNGSNDIELWHDGWSPFFGPTLVKTYAGPFGGGNTLDIADSVSFENYLYLITNDNIESGRWNSLTNVYTAMTYMPHGVCGIIFKGRLFIAQTAIQSGIRDRIYYSEPRTATSDFNSAPAWPSTNYFEVGDQSGDLVTGLAVVGDSLLILKTKSLWIFDFDSVPGNDGALRKLYDVGAIQACGYVVKDNTVYFNSVDGIYSLVNFQLVKLSDDISSGQLPNMSQSFSLGIVNNKLIVAGATNGTDYVYDLNGNYWTSFTGLNIKLRTKFLNIRKLGTEILMWVWGTDSTKIRYLSNTPSNISNGVLDETSFDFIARTKAFTFGSYTKFKRLFYLNFIGKSDVVGVDGVNALFAQITANFDGGFTSVTRQIVYNVATYRKSYKLKFAYRFREVSFEIKGRKTSAQTFECERIVPILSDANRLKEVVEVQ